jgi:hypothetical protein
MPLEVPLRVPPPEAPPQAVARAQPATPHLDLAETSRDVFLTPEPALFDIFLLYDPP